ncbi:hypothetical protein NLU13_5173 [Sarocladium strictum]|uniref:Cell wall galactomannoprotein n=1 Tax=Sarocladium strictum TaxID=5046 RepID=A0AA39GGD7_SARSR|nr:hypothetical protein NLU13_5173 [Sarocladium strictum]
MRVLATLAPVAVLVTQAVGQLSVIQGVLSGIQADVVAYGNAFTANNAASIGDTGDKLLATTTAGITTVQGATAVSLLDALSLRTSIQNLQNAVDVTYDNAVARQPAVEALGIAGDVHADFVAQRSTVAVLGAAIAAKVPASVRPLAQTYIDNIDASIAAAIEAYA